MMATDEKITVERLEPGYMDSNKSYYGKANIIRDNDGNLYLMSYRTIVCYFDNRGIFHRTWGGYSATTMKHVNTFMDRFGAGEGGKAWWDAQPVEREPWMPDWVYGHGKLGTCYY